MWAVSVAFGWSLFYVALGCYWVFGGAGFPFGRNDANGPDAGSLLAGLDRSTGAVIVAIVATLATVVAWLMLERQPAGWRGSLGRAIQGRCGGSLGRWFAGG